ncbi:hypothetical protein Tco_1034926 [Tanacetum coccineum]
MWIGDCYGDVSRPSIVGGWKLRWLVTRLKVRNGEDFSYIGGMLPLVYQLMAVKKTSFPETESSGSIVISIPDVGVKSGELIGNSGKMVTFVPITGGTTNIANALSRTDQVDYASRGAETLEF